MAKFINRLEQPPQPPGGQHTQGGISLVPLPSNDSMFSMWPQIEAFHLQDRAKARWTSYLSCLPKELFHELFEFLCGVGVWSAEAIELRHLYDFPSQESAALEQHDLLIKCIRLVGVDILATSSEDKTIKLWHIPSGQLRTTFRGHTDVVLTVELIDGILYSGGFDKTVRSWNMDTGKVIHTYAQHYGWVKCVQATSDWVVTGSADHAIRVFAKESPNQLIRQLAGHSNGVCCISPVLKGSQLISASWDHTIRYWDINTGQCLQVLTQHTDNICCLHIRGDQMVTGSCDKKLVLWDIPSRTTVREFVGHDQYVISCQMIGNSLVSTSYDKTLRVWNLNTGEQKLRMPTNGADFFVADRAQVIVVPLGTGRHIMRVLGAVPVKPRESE